MTGWESIAAVVIAAGGFLWSIFRDKTADVEDLSSRLAKLESDLTHVKTDVARLGNDSNLLIVFYVQIMPDDFVMQLHRF